LNQLFTEILLEGKDFYNQIPFFLLVVQKMEKLYQKIWQVLDESIVILSGEGKIIDINQKALNFLAIPKEKLIGKWIWETPYWNEMSETQEGLKQRFKRAKLGKFLNFETTYTTLAGDIQFFKIFLQPIKNGNGDVQYIIFRAQEITENKQIEQDLLKTQQYYRSIFYLFDQPIMIVSPAKGFITGNQATIELFGCKSEYEFVQEGPASLSPEFQPDGILSAVKAQQMMQLALKKGSHYFEWRHRKLSGENFDAIVYLTRLIAEKDKNLLHAWVRDISLQKKIEGEHRRLLKIIDATSDFVSTSDLQKQITYINPAGKKLIHWDEMDKYRLPAINELHPKWAWDRVKNVGIPEAEKHGRWEGETAIIDSKGIEIPVSQVIMSHRTSEGELEYYSTIIRDMREQKKAEQEIIRNQKLESISLLAGGIAHDFNNLLTSIVGNLSLIRIHAENNYSQLELVKEAEKAIVRASQLTKQLLTFSKGGDPIKKLFDVRITIEDSANFVSHGSNCKIKYQFEPDLWYIKADSGQISQVLQNLVINAIQSMPNGGLISISAKNAILPINNSYGLKERNYIKICVTDNGQGIAPEHISKIFDPYYSTKPKGSGLGLSICLSIILKHAGTITVHSELNQGATFEIYLPAFIKKQHQRENLNADKGYSLPKGINVLVLEDDRAIITLIDKFLTNLGWKFTMVTQSQKAIDIFQEYRNTSNKFDLLLLDLTIPGGIGGAEVHSILRKIDPDIKSIASSGYFTGNIIQNYKEYGFTGVLPKPYTYKDFITVIAEIFK
jgi:PAS domain S-box-containing protein